MIEAQSARYICCPLGTGACTTIDLSKASCASVRAASSRETKDQAFITLSPRQNHAFQLATADRPVGGCAALALCLLLLCPVLV
jgi:hypothetical protein